MVKEAIKVNEILVENMSKRHHVTLLITLLETLRESLN